LGEEKGTIQRNQNRNTEKKEKSNSFWWKWSVEKPTLSFPPLWCVKQKEASQQRIKGKAWIEGRKA